jgi:hypothetical protein
MPFHFAVSFEMPTVGQATEVYDGYVLVTSAKLVTLVCVSSMMDDVDCDVEFDWLR